MVGIGLGGVSVVSDWVIMLLDGLSALEGSRAVLDLEQYNTYYCSLVKVEILIIMLPRITPL